MSIVTQGSIDQSIHDSAFKPEDDKQTKEETINGHTKDQQNKPSNPDSTIVISNIDPVITLTDLTDVLRDCGTIKQSNISHHPHTNERICLIEFSDVTAVDSALIVGGLNVALGEKVLVIERYSEAVKSWSAPTSSPVIAVSPAHQTTSLQPHQPQPVPPIPSFVASPTHIVPSLSLPQSATIYVGNLSPAINEDLLHHYFCQVGPVAAVRLQIDATQTGRYAFVEFLQPSSAERAMSLNGALLIDRHMKIGPASNSSSTAAKPGVLAQLASATPDAIVEKVAELSQAMGADPSKLTSALAKVAEAQRLVAQKMGVGLHQALPDPVQILTVADELTTQPPASVAQETKEPRARSRSRGRSRSSSPDSRSRHHSSRRSYRRSRSRSRSPHQSSRHSSRSSRRRRSRSRSKSPHRHRSSRSSRYDDDRSPRRSRHRHSSDDDTEDRSRHSRFPRRREPKPDGGPNVEMVFDGFNWTPVPVVPAAPVAAVTSQ